MGEGFGGLVYIDAYARVDVGLAAAVSAGGEENTRGLLAVEQYIIGPLDARFQACDGLYGAGDGEGTDDMEAGGDGGRGAQDEGNCNGGVFLGDPLPVEAAAPGSLVIGHNSRALGGAGQGLHVGDVHGGGEGFVEEKLAADEGSGEVAAYGVVGEGFGVGRGQEASSMSRRMAWAALWPGAPET